MAARLAVPGRQHPQPAAPRRWRPDVPRRGAAVGSGAASGRPTARRPWRSTAGPADGEVHAEAWGDGAGWALESVPGLLGAHDDWTGFEPRHPVLEEARRRHPHARLGRSGLVMEALVPAIIEQKVTGQEAFAGFRRLVHRYGERAPGPGPRAAAVGPAESRDAAAGAVVGVAADAHRPGPVTHRGHRRPGRRQPRAHRDAAARGGRPTAAHHPRRRRLDQRRGPSARPRRPRRGVVRRLPRRQGRRLGADRDAVRRRASSRSSSSPTAPSAAGSRPWSPWRGCAGRAAGRGWRRAPTSRSGRPELSDPAEVARRTASRPIPHRRRTP